MAHFLFATAIFLLFSCDLRADELESLEISTETSGNTETGTPSAELESGEAPNPPSPKIPAKAQESRRFTLENRERTRSWLVRLCEEEATELLESRQKIRRQDGYLLRIPKNKQGSLQLLLENYLQALDHRESCEKNKDSKNCATTSEGKNKAHLSAELIIQQIRDNLRSEFYELRDLSELDGKPGSQKKAQAVLRKIEELSTCQTRALKESFTPKKAPTN